MLRALPSLVPTLVRSSSTPTSCTQELILRQLSSYSASARPAALSDPEGGSGSLLRLAGVLKERGVVVDPGFIGDEAALEQGDANAAIVKGFQQSHLPLRNYLRNAIDYQGPYKQWFKVRRPPYLTNAHKLIALSIWSGESAAAATQKLERAALWEMCSNGDNADAFASKTQFCVGLADLCDAGLVKTFPSTKKNGRFTYGLTKLGTLYVVAVSKAASQAAPSPAS